MITRANLNCVNKYWFNKSTPKFACKENVYANTGRSSRPEVFCRKGVLRNFAKFTGKHLHLSLLFKLYWKWDSSTAVFLWIFSEISKNTFFYRTPLLAVSGQDLVILPLKGWLQLQIFLFIIRILKFLEKTLLECSFYVLYYSPQGIGRGH